MSINERINDYMTANGIKQVFVANATGIPIDALSKMLNGKRRILATEFLAICEVLNLDPNIFRAA